MRDLCQCQNSWMSGASRARYELFRRRSLVSNSPVLRRAAEKLHEANPGIIAEFVEIPYAELIGISSDCEIEYARAAAEGRA